MPRSFWADVRLIQENIPDMYVRGKIAQQFIFLQQIGQIGLGLEKKFGPDKRLWTPYQAAAHDVVHDFMNQIVSKLEVLREQYPTAIIVTRSAIN